MSVQTLWECQWILINKDIAKILNDGDHSDLEDASYTGDITDNTDDTAINKKIATLISMETTLIQQV